MNTEMVPVPRNQIETLARQYDVKPLVLLQDYDQLPLDADISTRPYITFLAESRTYRRVVIKAAQKPGYEGRLLKTVLIRDAIMRIPEAEYPQYSPNTVGIPAAIDNKDADSVMEEYVFMRPIGSNHAVEKHRLKAQHIDPIVDMLGRIRQTGQPFVGRNDFLHFRISYPFDPVQTDGKFNDKYHHDLFKNPNRMDRVRTIMGDHFIEQMMYLLSSDRTRALFKSDVPRYFVWGNVVAGKIGINEQDKLWFYDAERCCHTPQPATDYIALYTTLWSDPVLQDSFLKASMERNKYIPSFFDYMRLDFIYNRGAGELAFWSEQLEKTTLDRDALFCSQAITRIQFLLHQAINHEGLWNPKLYETVAL